MNYGLFLNALISFVLIARAIFFFVVKPMNALAARRAAGEPAEEPTTKVCPHCASAIPVAARRCPMCTSELSDRLAARLQHPLEVRRRLGATSAPRQPGSQLGCVQHQARRAADGPRVAVARVAQHWVADGVAVHPDLVAPSGERHDLQQVGIPEPLAQR